jgi:hypothetical protein
MELRVEITEIIIKTKGLIGDDDFDYDKGS